MPGTPVEDLRAEMPSATAKSTPTTSNAAPDPTSRVAVADDNGPSDDDDDGCKRLTDFDGDQTAQWIVVNDGVMGGALKRDDHRVRLGDAVHRQRRHCGRRLHLGSASP